MSAVLGRTGNGKEPTLMLNLWLALELAILGHHHQFSCAKARVSPKKKPRPTSSVESAESDAAHDSSRLYTYTASRSTCSALMKPATCYPGYLKSDRLRT